MGFDQFLSKLILTPENANSITNSFIWQSCTAAGLTVSSKLMALISAKTRAICCQTAGDKSLKRYKMGPIFRGNDADLIW